MAPAVAELERRAAGGPAAIVPTTPVSPAVTAPVASKPAPPTETPGLAKTLPAAPKSVAPVTNPLAGMPAALSLVDPSPTALSPAPKSLAPPSPAASTSAASSPAVPSPAAQSPTAPLPIAASPPASPAAVSPAVSPAAQSTAPEPEPSKAGIIDPTLSDEDTTPRATPARAPKPSFAVVSRKRKAAIVLQAPLGPKKASVLPAVKKRNVATAEIIIVSD
ncbi:hypothetical protein B0H67DRAFT_566452 [Lasiosphaeris hirsuta]|uniref:Uncharacterized protein n=1 Tax=Lasiosphaeris hirsuta TaxID=260670 RepID=A0AA40EBC9_9PEZI|nr:hypothetical protein B0H67DRAFT_566452 [Lasiosphaeris hirsuta]